jgi:hypothetical protein
LRHQSRERNELNELNELKGDAMGKEARIGLLLGAAACLGAVMVDWVVEELHQHEDMRRGN